jgi:hypothetical protein
MWKECVILSFIGVHLLELLVFKIIRCIGRVRPINISFF